MPIRGRKTGAPAPIRTCTLAGALSAAGLAMGLAAPAEALVIKPYYDVSVTSRADSAQIQSAFNTVAQYYGSQFSNNATVNVAVQWGKVKGQTMSSGVVGTTIDNMYGGFNYSQVKSYLAAAANSNSQNTALQSAVSHLPASISGLNQFAIPYAEAKALGLIAPTAVAQDSFIGFSSTYAFDYNPADGIAANTYDFQAVAAHELAHALGRLSGLQSTAPTYRTPLDLFRYSAPGVLSFGFYNASYFSIDGGVTKLGDFNNQGSLDRDAWLMSTTGVGDVQAPFATTGKRFNVTARDLTVLDLLGWGGLNAGNTYLSNGSFVARSFMAGETDGVPEPATWATMIAGAGLMGAQLRRRRRAASAA